MSDRDDARDRLLLSMSEAIIWLLDGCDDEKARMQIAHNLTECNKDLLLASAIGHGPP